MARKTYPLDPDSQAALFRYFLSMSPIPDSELVEFSKHAGVQKFEKGEVFTSIGETTRRLGLVVSGGFLVQYVTATGNNRVRNICTKGMPIGSLGTILTGTPAHVEIIAFEPSVAVVIEHNALENHYPRHPMWERLGRRIAEIQYLKREDREYQLLTLNATERYQRFLDEYQGLSERVTQATIASYVGITPVALSRIINRK